MEHNDIKKLFAVLQARYGHKWTSAYDDPAIMSIAVQEWHRELQGFRPEDIRTGLEMWRDPWPPSLPEFVDACMPDLEELGYNVDALVKRRLPGYYYEAQNSQEEMKRIKTAEKVRKEVIAEIKRDALSMIATEGITALLGKDTLKAIDYRD